MIKEKVFYYLLKEKTIQTKKKIDTKSSDVISITCMNEGSAKTAKRILDAKLSHVYKVEEEQLSKPIIRITGIENEYKSDLKSLGKDINQKNFSNLDKNGKILHVEGNDKSSKLTVIMEITAEMHKHIKENKDRLFVGYQNCKVYDVINVKPCYKCGRLGHNGQRCRNNPTCLKCAGTHLTEKCTT